MKLFNINKLKRMLIKAKCSIFGHVWLYSDNTHSVFLTKRQCSKCGLLQNWLAIRFVDSFYYVDQGFSITQKEVDDAKKAYKTEHGIIE